MILNNKKYKLQIKDNRYNIILHFINKPNKVILVILNKIIYQIYFMAKILICQNNNKFILRMKVVKTNLKN